MRQRRTTPPPARLHWAFFLDVDGTLIDIADSPSAVRVDDTLLGLVARLHQACGGALALVSGRSIADLDARLGSIRIPLAGQHGLERRDARGRLHVHAPLPPARRELAHYLAGLTARHPGILLEDKGLSYAIHYRKAPQLASWLHTSLRRWIDQHGAGLQIQRGQRVIEVKPAGYDKGTAIAEFAGEVPFRGRTPVFIGDDLTDEHGFARVNELGGYAIKVGSGPSCAEWKLAHVHAVRAWLHAALDPEENEFENTRSRPHR